MQVQPIQSLQTIAGIEARPYAAFIEHEHIYDALADTARRFATRRALTYVTSTDPRQPAQGWNYAQFIAQVHRAGNLFTELAGDEPPRIALLLPAMPQAHFALWGGEAVGVVCPINYLLETGHIAELINAARANILVALGPDPALDIWSKARALPELCPGLRHALSVGPAPGWADFDAECTRRADGRLARRVRAEPDQLAALFHTGGTTGAPKLAQHTHGNQLHSAWSAAQMYAMTEDDVIINGFPMFHVAGAFVYGLSALLSGAEIVLPTLLGMRNAGFVERYWRFVERHRVSLLAAVPTVMAALLELEPEPARVASVRALLTGGSPLPNELAGAFESRFGIPVRNILGMTECAGVVSIEPFLAARTNGSCGLRLPFTEVRAVRGDGSACAAGESGILQLRGPNVGPGYTDARRNTGTFAEGGWLVTGDIGHVDGEGRIFVTGRSKDLIIRSGHNIDPQAIEEVLLQHPDVLMVAAVGQPDAYAGELPVAYVSLKAGACANEQALREFANARIAERPAWLKRLSVLPAMPMTAVGKVYKPRLRALACEHALRERLRELPGRVEVAVHEAPGGLRAVFTVPDGAGADNLAPRLRRMMSPFAIAYELAPAAAAGDLA